MNNSRASALFCLAGASLAVVPSSHGLFSLGGDSGLFVVLEQKLLFEDNLFYTETLEQESYIWVASPGLEFVMGTEESVYDFSIIFQPRFKIYSEDNFETVGGETETDLDTEELYGAAEFNFDNGVALGTAFVIYDETTSPSAELTDALLLEAENFRIGANGEYAVTGKIAVGAGVSYTDVAFSDESRRRAFVRDREEYSFIVNGFYGITEKIDVRAGFRYRQHDISENLFGATGYEFQSLYYNVGVRGEISPNLVADVTVGYETVDVDEGGPDADDGLALEGFLQWQPTEKFLSRLTVFREARATDLGLIKIDSGGTAELNYEVTPMLNAIGGLTIQNSDYQIISGREDDYFDIFAGVGYDPFEFLSLGFKLTFRDNDSNIEGTSFEAYTVEFSASARY